MLNAALIIDGNSVARWQKDALDYANDLLNIRIILSCKNTNTKRNYCKNFLYYVINYFTLKNHLTSRVYFSSENIKVIEFDSIHDGMWQKIPSFISDELGNLGIDVVIKFGMSLLRIDGKLSDLKIFSYHHGDPNYYKGRPAGFYELLHKHSSVGTIVQEISNKLDSGKVWAICHSKIYHHSYNKSALNFYSNSKFLLRKSLINLENNSPINTSSNGTNYKLPGNLLVIKYSG